MINQKELTYEKATARLEQIVDILEDSSTSLDDSLKLFEEGTELATFCNKVLSEAEQKIVKLSGVKGEDVNE